MVVVRLARQSASLFFAASPAAPARGKKLLADSPSHAMEK
jgi:hypothetical protein